MNQSSAKWNIAAIGVLGLAPVSVLFGMTLLPTRAVAEKAGTIVPWFLTWGVIWMTALIAVGLAGFLIVTGRSKDANS
jgi:hypothetical protein